MDTIKVLVVDDESRMRKLVRDFLAKKNYTVVEAGDGVEALDKFFEEKDVSLVILDVMMPKMDGWQVLREIREYSQVPVIMLTAKADERDELQGFDYGADEYISKPFSPKILVARVEALLKRTVKQEEIVYNIGGIELDTEGRTVKVDSKKVELSLREYELLKYLIDNKGIKLPNDLNKKIWQIVTSKIMSLLIVLIVNLY